MVNIGEMKVTLTLIYYSFTIFNTFLIAGIVGFSLRVPALTLGKVSIWGNASVNGKWLESPKLLGSAALEPTPSESFKSPPRPYTWYPC